MPTLVTQGLGGPALVTQGLGFSGAATEAPASPWLGHGLNATARVEVNANASGASRSAHGSPSPAYVPVSGAGALRLVLIRERRSVEFDERPQNVVFWKALYGRGLALDLRHRLVLQDDPDRPSKARYLEVIEPSEHVFRRGHRSVRLAERFGQPVS